MKTKTVLMLAASLILTWSINYGQGTDTNWSNTPVEVKKVESQKGLVIKAEVSMAEIGEAMETIYSRLFAYLQENNIPPAGPAFAVYHTWDPAGKIVFEAGVAIKKKLDGKDDIEYREYPEMKAAVTMYTGAYENMEPVYGVIQQYLADHNMELSGATWEVYLTDPSSVEDPSMNQTLIYFPVK